MVPVDVAHTPETRLVPSAEEVQPWVDTLIRLWDDPVIYAQERQRCLAAAEAWRPERLAPRFEQFFARVLEKGGKLTACANP